MANTSALTLTAARIVGGVWEGQVAGADAPPDLRVTHEGVALAGVEVTPLAAAAGGHLVRVPIPASLLNEGVQTFLIQSGPETLARFTVIVGVPMEDDIRAEMGILRAELDMLKRAFRRHCTEPSG